MYDCRPANDCCKPPPPSAVERGIVVDSRALLEDASSKDDGEDADANVGGQQRGCSAAYSTGSMGSSGRESPENDSRSDDDGGATVECDPDEPELATVDSHLLSGGRGRTTLEKKNNNNNNNDADTEKDKDRTCCEMSSAAVGAEVDEDGRAAAEYPASSTKQKSRISRQ